MKLRKRLFNPVLLIAVIMGCLILSHSLQAESWKMVEAGQSILAKCEAQGIEVPESFRTALNRVESLNESKIDPTLFNRQMQGASMVAVEEIVELDWNGSSWDNVSKEIISLNDAMTQALSIVFQEWVGGVWVNDGRMVMTLNGQGLITSMALDVWLNGAWVPQMLFSYFYDGSGNAIEEIIQIDSNYDGVLENVSRTVNTYSGGLLVKSEDYQWYGSWQKYMETTYTYNGQGQLIEEVSFMDIGYGYIFYTSKIIYTYTGAGDVETETIQTYETYSSTWINNTKYTSTYNGQRQVTSDLTQTWSGSAWVNVTLHSTTYGGPGGAETVDLWQNWDGSAWVNMNRSTYGYDGSGNQTTYLDEIWNGASWENDEKGVTTFNSSEQPTLEIIQVWEGGIWVNDTRYEYTYSGGTAVDDSPVVLPDAFSMTNYPNPFNPSTTIQFALPVADQLSVTIYDATGRRVTTLIQNESVSAGIHEVHWNGTNAFSQPVASGVYFYSIQGLQFNQTNRCLLLK